MLRRVVVTGLGAVSPLGGNLKTTWDRLISGHSGIGKVQRCDTTDLPVSIGGEVPMGEEPGQLNVDDYLSGKEQRKVDTFIHFAIAASDQALADSGYKAETEEQQDRSGVMVGSGIGGLPGIYDASITLKERGARRVSPFFIPSTLVNLASGNISIRNQFRGPNHATVTACSAGAHAIGDAARMIAFGDADVMLAGGAESAICPIGIAGFAAARALSTRNDEPEKASRPWDIHRDGFVMGEGSGVMVLEDLEHAKKRGAKIYAEVVGYGLSGDAHHVTSPPDDAHGAYRAMKMARERAGLNPEDIDYINAHGTSTPAGDLGELRAIKRFLDGKTDHVSISSTKSAIGHLLGAAGGIEAVFSVKAIENQIAPPTLNLDEPEPESEGIDLVPHKAKERKITYAMSNSFGFGGTNSSLIFKKFES